LSPGALCPALTPHYFEFIGDAGNAVLDAPTVRFQLRFTVAPHTDTAFLPR
jgi:hypothetical protein